MSIVVGSLIDSFAFGRSIVFTTKRDRKPQSHVRHRSIFTRADIVSVLVMLWVSPHRLLPEAYIYGLADTKNFGRLLPSYLWTPHSPGITWYYLEASP